MHVNRFMANIDNMARQNKFEVEIRCPQIGLYMRGMRCKTAVLPGKSFETTAFSEIPQGPKQQYITGVTYAQDVTLGFLLDSYLEDKQKFEVWQKAMFNRDYALRYPDKYEGTVKIKQLDMADNVMYTVTLHKAWPQTIGNSTLDMEASAISTMDVTFAYRTWSADGRSYWREDILGKLADQGRKRLAAKGREKIEDLVYDKIKPGGLSGKLYKLLGID